MRYLNGYLAGKQTALGRFRYFVDPGSEVGGPINVAQKLKPLSFATHQALTKEDDTVPKSAPERVKLELL